MNIPTIGGTRGIFEIFVPGTFVIINLGIFVYLSPFIDKNTKDLLATVSSNSVLGIIAVICFGYLFGVLLRLLSVDLPDNLSAVWLRWFNRNARKEQANYQLFSTEAFPYIGWIEEACKQCLPPEASDFYGETWAKRKPRGKPGVQNKQFINFLKVMIASNDERAANEIYAAEALTRYIAGMFYALTFSFILTLAVFMLHTIVSGQIMSVLVIISLLYFIAIINI
jgi:hypothetical protein